MSAHRYAVTFDHTATTGGMREQCQECGCIRWTVSGKALTEYMPQGSKRVSCTAPVAPASESDHGQPSGTTGAAQPAADVHPSS